MKEDDDIEEQQAKVRFNLQTKLWALASTGNINEAIAYIKDHEASFKTAGFSQFQKSDMRRFFNYTTTEDSLYLDSVLGSYEDSKPTPANTQRAEIYTRAMRRIYPKDPRGWMAYLADQTFEHAKNWLNDPSNPERWFKDLDEMGKAELRDMIEQIKNNHVCSWQEEYDPDTDDSWMNNIKTLYG